MLRKEDSKLYVDPDQPMVGTCSTCGGRVVTTRGQCEEMADGFGGKAPHAMCPNLINNGDTFGDAPMARKRCGRRVRMSPVEE